MRTLTQKDTLITTDVAVTVKPVKKDPPIRDQPAMPHLRLRAVVQCNIVKYTSVERPLVLKDRFRWQL